MEFNRQDCNILKGMAIVCIFLHNFCHLLSFAPVENEYSWTIDKTWAFIGNISCNFFVSLFSFLGHYGVAVFVFLSGYGLVRKYGIIKEIDIKEFIFNHYLKLFKLMFPGFVLYYALHRILYEDYDGITLLRLVSQMLFVNNLIPTEISSIVPGPYWYFGLTMQLYLLFLLLNNCSFIKQCCFILCCVFALLFSKDHHYMTVWLKYNFVGSIIPFVLGGCMAKYKEIFDFSKNNFIWGIVSIVSLVFLFLSEFSFYTWIFASVFALCFSICTAKLFNRFFCSFFSSIGRVAHLIFVIHPIVRTLVFYLQNEFLLKWQLGIVLYAVLTLCFSLLLSYFTSGIKIIRQ